MNAELSSFMYTGWIIFIPLLIGIVLEVMEFDSSVLLGSVVITMALLYAKYEPSPLIMGITSVVYLIIGFCYSFWRYRSFISENVKQLRAKFVHVSWDNLTNEDIDTRLNALKMYGLPITKEPIAEMYSKFRQLEEIQYVLENPDVEDYDVEDSEIAKYTIESVKIEFEAVAQKLVEQIKIEYDYQFNQKLKELEPLNVIRMLVTWILIWPLSLIANIFKDIAELIEMCLKRWVMKAYDNVYQSVISEILT